MTDSDERAVEPGGDGQGRAAVDGPPVGAVGSADGPRVGVVAFGGLVLVSSVVPVPAAASAGGGSAFPPAILPAWLGLTGAFHLVGYAALAALASRAAVRTGRAPVAAAAVAVAAATGFGFGIELVQAPIPWRSFAWSDAAVNAVGAVLGAGAVAAGLAPRRGARGTGDER